MPRNSIDIASAYMSRSRAPRFKGRARRCYSSIDIGAGSGGDLCQPLAGRGIDAVNRLATGRLDPLVIDEKIKGGTFLDPCPPGGSGLWSRSIFPLPQHFLYVPLPPSLFNP